MFDTHAHLNFEDFEKDREKIIEECLVTGVGVFNIGATLSTSQKAVEIAEDEKGVWAVVGVHPLHAEEEFDFEKLEGLVDNSSVVAVGETGLDFKKRETEESQRKVFNRHIDLAKEKDLPLMLHSRRAHEEVLEILPDWKGVIHCFSGGLKEAKNYIDKGFMIGLNGLIFKMDLENVIREVPLEKIVLETDCPYLNPPGVKGKNTPLSVKKVAQKVAEIKGLDVEKLEEVTDENVKETFGL